MLYFYCLFKVLWGGDELAYLLRLTKGNCSFENQDNLKTLEYSCFNIVTKGQSKYKTVPIILYKPIPYHIYKDKTEVT